MGRKKCKVCLSCFNLAYVDNQRYYHCWLCNTWYTGRDEELQLVPNPHNEKIIMIQEQEMGASDFEQIMFALTELEKLLDKYEFRTVTDTLNGFGFLDERALEYVKSELEKAKAKAEK